MNTAARKIALEARISDLVGAPVTLTVRNDRAFTFSTDEVCDHLGDRIAAFFGKLAAVTVQHDAECGSFAYVQVPAR